MPTYISVILITKVTILAWLEKTVNGAWYGDALWPHLLRPLSAVYCFVMQRRAAQYAVKAKQGQLWQSPVPIIVIGNITVGGSGKTPLTLHTCGVLLDAGYKPAILSRGYKAKIVAFPRLLLDTDKAQAVGDEPWLMQRNSGRPVCIDPDRVRGAQHLLANTDCDVIVCDDGLQHLNLARDIEIAVVDGQRLLGNGFCLPAGPLREKSQRLAAVDFVVANGQPQDSLFECDYVMRLQNLCFINLVTDEQLSCATFVQQFDGQDVKALTGIGNPQRFFTGLQQLGLDVDAHAYPDHYPLTDSDLGPFSAATIVMTEKDAVKCAGLANDNAWYLAVKADLPNRYTTALVSKLATVVGARGILEVAQG